jgi:hypothetical protein
MKPLDYSISINSIAYSEIQNLRRHGCMHVSHGCVREITAQMPMTFATASRRNGSTDRAENRYRADYHSRHGCTQLAADDLAQVTLAQMGGDWNEA